MRLASVICTCYNNHKIVRMHRDCRVLFVTQLLVSSPDPQLEGLGTRLPSFLFLSMNA